MSTATEIHRRFWQVIKARDWAAMRSMYHRDYVYTDTDGIEHGDPGTSVALFRYLFTAFPDTEFDFLAVHEVGSSISSTELVCHGTHLGRLGAIPPTNRRLALRACHVIEVADGRIVAEREYFDTFSMLKQLGLVPTTLSSG